MYTAMYTGGGAGGGVGAAIGLLNFGATQSGKRMTIAAFKEPWSPSNAPSLNPRLAPQIHIRNALTLSSSCTSSTVHSSRWRLPVTVTLGGLTRGLESGVISHDERARPAIADAGVRGSSEAADEAECSLAPVEQSDATEPLDTEVGRGRCRGRV